MKEQRFQEILAELERYDFQVVLNMTRECFKEHGHKELSSYFEVGLRFNWHQGEEHLTMEGDQIVTLLKSLPRERRMCLADILIKPIIEFEDATGKRLKFYQDASSIFYSGDVQPHWQELHCLIEEGTEQTFSRSSLAPGCIVASTPSGPLQVFSMSDATIALMLGTQVVKLQENHECMDECFPEVKAALFYNHDEYPALWQWLYIDELDDGKTPWYGYHRSKKEDLSEGMEFLALKEENLTLRILEIKEKSVKLFLRQFFHTETIVLDQPNKEVVIWQKEKRCLKATLRVPEPEKDESYHFQSDSIPEGCMVTYSVVKNGEQIHEHEETKVIRMLPGELRPKHYENHNRGVIYNWPIVWGFIDGKMVVGMGCPEKDYDKCVFWGVLTPGQQYTFPIGEFRDWTKEDEAQVTLRWECVKVDLEIKEGLLKSVPDQEEIVVPETVREIDFPALLSAPSLRKITIHSGVTSYSVAIREFNRKYPVKLDVAYEGSLQQWFDTASGLAGHIGHLFIQGKEYDFYETEDLVIPEGVSRIGEEFFSSSEVLRSVVLPEEVVEVDSRAFQFCDKLKSVKVLGPASIGYSAFSYCEALSDIYLADGVVSLAEGCFDGLKKVESIFIPSSVETAGRICSLGHEDNYRQPRLYCAAPSRPSGWSEVWNLAYFDTQFGFGCGHDFYLPTFWEAKR